MHERIIKKIPIRDLMDLKVDFAFKQLFGSETNKEITIVFLNALLQKTNRSTAERARAHMTEAPHQKRHCPKLNSVRIFLFL